MSLFKRFTQHASPRSRQPRRASHFSFLLVFTLLPLPLHAGGEASAEHGFFESPSPPDALSTATATGAATTPRVSVSSGAGQASGWSAGATINSGGRFIAHSSGASNLLAADTTGTKFQAPVISKDGGVVASISDYSSAVGIDVLNRGGNAVDAAVAMVFAVGVARPDMGGIGGGGFLLYRSPTGEVAGLDFREVAPAAVDSMTFTGAGMHKDTDFCDSPAGSGHGLVGVPGVVAGMAEALRRFGSGKFTLGQLITNGDDLTRTR